MISFCPDCGKNIQAAFKFCPYCGHSLPIEEHVVSQTFVKPRVSSSRGSKRELNSSFEISPKKVKWSSSVTSPPLFSDYDSSESEDTPSSSERSKGSGSRLPTPKSSPQKTRKNPQKTRKSPQKTRQSPQVTKCSPQKTRQSPQTLKRSRVTTSLEALPIGTVLTDKSGRQWKLMSLQTRDDQGILYEEVPTGQTSLWAILSLLLAIPDLESGQVGGTASVSAPKLSLTWLRHAEGAPANSSGTLP
ncbi:Inactive serine/threonine-protein kinase vrk3 [Saguinus oedipus]|uniref:Inactive serine/threonine-protein kinase vrk3 n=1 Tax=Saguinus oedipus TaxID=9490 RepID=A0ABQ9TVZ0_SAGOE|nr:Inactive serine/threonine-protein kinase vrk3 [Saguinus oedipus]